MEDHEQKHTRGKMVKFQSKDDINEGEYRNHVQNIFEYFKLNGVKMDTGINCCMAAILTLAHHCEIEKGALKFFLDEALKTYEGIGQENFPPSDFSIQYAEKTENESEKEISKCSEMLIEACKLNKFKPSLSIAGLLGAILLISNAIKLPKDLVDKMFDEAKAVFDEVE